MFVNKQDNFHKKSHIKQDKDTIKDSYSTYSFTTAKENQNCSTQQYSQSNSCSKNKYNTGVLKFEGYFTEAVEYSQLESSRIRHLIIFYYLEDNTISVNEPKQRNSGIMQGTFLNRQRVLNNETNQYLSLYDFQIGQTVEICGRSIFISNVDQPTRLFFQDIGCALENDINITEDNFEKIVLRSYIPKPFYGLNSSVLNGRVPIQKQFLENDRKVLKFNVESLGEPFIIHYYLADDMMEVCEVKVVNCGKNPFPLLIKK